MDLKDAWRVARSSANREHIAQTATAGRLGDAATLMLEADILLLYDPADATEPRSINVYSVDVLDFDAVGDKKFKIDPQSLLYSLQWRHNATPPDLHLQLVCAPSLWFDRVASSLLGALNRHHPHLFDALRAN